MVVPASVVEDSQSVSRWDASYREAELEISNGAIIYHEALDYAVHYSPAATDQSTERFTVIKFLNLTTDTVYTPRLVNGIPFYKYYRNNTLDGNVVEGLFCSLSLIDSSEVARGPKIRPHENSDLKYVVVDG